MASTTESAMIKIRTMQAIEFGRARHPPDRVELTVAPGRRIVYVLRMRRHTLNEDAQDQYYLDNAPDGYECAPQEISIDRMRDVMRALTMGKTLAQAF